MKTLNMEEIHEVALGILKKIDEITAKLDLQYFLAYGTLIGAVRDHGFIPWDDDVDIMMFRKDYDIFAEYCISHEKEISPYRLCSLKTNPDYPHMIDRLCDSRYPIRVKNEVPCGQGVFVDIYPLAVMGSDLKALQPVIKKCHRLADRDFWSTRVHFEIPGKWYRTPDKFIRYCLAKYRGKEYFEKQLAAMGELFDFEDSKYIGVITWGTDMMYFDKRLFRRAIRMQFQDFQAPVPVGYDRILKKLYGDYKKLPPQKKRRAQHHYLAYKK